MKSEKRRRKKTNIEKPKRKVTETTLAQRERERVIKGRKKGKKVIFIFSENK